MAHEQKTTCWEFKQCGREPGGENVKKLGVCPVAVEMRADSIHHGKNGGRCCWVVAGSLRKLENPGKDAREFDTCQQCSFYKKVKEEEHPHFKVVTIVLNEVKSRTAPPQRG